jgi:hypothetical protein
MAPRTHKKRSRRQRRNSACRSTRIGALLLDLHSALRRVELCRRALNNMGFSQRRWQEIVNDLDPDLRFLVRPKLLDAIVSYLDSAAEPVCRDVLVRELTAQGAGLLLRVEHSIAANLRNQSLVLYPDDKIGLPEWKTSIQGPR